MVTAPVMVGSALVRLIRCGPAPAMLKWIRSAPPAPLAVLLAAVIASRRLMTPSAPRLLASAASEAVLPSATSLTVVTVISP